MAKELIRDELFDVADLLDACASSLNKYIFDDIMALPGPVLTQLRVTEARLQDLSARLRTAAIQDVVTDLEDPRKELQQFTQDIIEEIEKFQRINTALKMIADLIKVANAILNVVTGLTPPPATISPPL